jgi:UDP-N-acetylglucosamine 2-epimerase (non-hydrolysing)
MVIDLIAGARPNFIKIAPLVEAIQCKKEQGMEIGYRLIHTGQHYDKSMSDSFFQELEIPSPHHNLGAGSGSQAEQTARIMTGYEKVLEQKNTDLCLVVGDVTSTMACAITARKMLVPVAHVEAGIRSGDWSMPEEINRVVTDSITNYFFTTSETAGQNLLKSGVEKDRIYFVGNTMIDTLLKCRSRFTKPRVWNDLNLKDRQFFVLTLHRPANVDAQRHLKATLEAIMEARRNIPVVFPVHPRTARHLEEAGIHLEGLHTIAPLSYLQFNYLVERAKAVITDSGGITEETTVMGVPCMTLRDNTERPETITMGTNELIGTNPENIRPAMDRLFAGKWKKGVIPEKWDGRSAKRIIEILTGVYLS